MTGSFLKDMQGKRRTYVKNQSERLDDGKIEVKVINVKYSTASCKDAAWAAKLAWENEAKCRRPQDPASKLWQQDHTEIITNTKVRREWVGLGCVGMRLV